MALVVYWWRHQWPMRRWERERLQAWSHYFPGHVVNLNAAFSFRSGEVSRLDPDLIIYDATVLATRYREAGWENLGRVVEALSRSTAPRIALPLDDYIGVRRLRQILADARIDLLLTASSQPATGALYPNPSFAIREILTAYIDDRLIGLARRSARPMARRDVWVGYRVWGTEPWLGRMSALKRDVGLVAETWAHARRAPADISVDGSRGLVGDDWIRFLGRVRATVGVEGGSSTLDPTGGPVGEGAPPVSGAPASVDPPAFELRALSPRHLEAAATRTLQVLVEGRYSGVLTAGDHYLPIRQDLSDIADKLDRLFDADAVHAITDRAYEHVVGSGQYTWRGLIQPLARELLA